MSEDDAVLLSTFFGGAVTAANDASCQELLPV